MDVQARHSTWSLLQKFKREKKCTILLTTHFMDEADVLGDRIAIMSQGKLRCCGSSAYLKSKYGSGYNLTITKRKEDSSQQNEDQNMSSNEIIELVKSHLPSASLNSNINSEISFILPMEQTNKFARLFEKLESQKETLNILNIGISITTLEDVFLRLAEENSSISNEIQQNDSKSINSTVNEIGADNSSLKKDNDEFTDCGLWTGSKEQDRVSDLALLGQQFYALLVKRFIHSIRNKTLIISQLIVPLIILSINLVYLKYAPTKAEDSPPLVITLSRYAKNYVPYNFYRNNNETNRMGNLYAARVNMDSNSNPFLLQSTEIVDMCADKRSYIDEFMSCVGRISFNYIIDNYIIAADFLISPEIKRIQVLGYFNNQPFHVPPLTLNYLTNTLYNYYTNSSDRLITVINHPLPRNLDESISDSQLKDATGFNVASGLSFGMSEIF
jgi:ATP-binding cassette subfamily A (ABC1) protein 3